MRIKRTFIIIIIIIIIIKTQLEIKKKFLNSWFPSFLRQVAKHHAYIEYMWISGRNLEGLQSG